MPSWHQLNAGVPPLWHPTKWRSYNPEGHMCVMTHESEEACKAYCLRTGDVPVPPKPSKEGPT